MYLIGDFSRSYFDWQDQDPMSTTFIVEKLTKQHLISAKNDNDYQVIDLIKREYYDPKTNNWVKIEKL